MTGIRAADHLVDLLVAQGTSHIFGVPGESYLPVLDALYGREGEIRFITSRQEGGAAMSADAHARMTGRPGVCMVTRGPGAMNASAGLHVAFQDSTPLILFVGQVARNTTEREGFQEIDYRRMFGQVAKWVAEIDDANRLQEFISRAYRTALSGRPGPVVLSLPEDMLYERIDPPRAPRKVMPPRYQPAKSALEELHAKLARSSRPLIMAGGGGWTASGVRYLQDFAEKQGLPVAVSLRRQDLMDNDHPNYVGHFSIGQTPYLAQVLDETDLLIAIGPRLGDVTTGGYSLMDVPVPKQSIAHVFPQPEEPGRVFEPEISLISDVNSFCETVAQWDRVKRTGTIEWVGQLRKKYQEHCIPAPKPDDLVDQIFMHMAEVLPPDAVVSSGAGKYSGSVLRYYGHRRFGTQLAPTSGSMGYGLPAAVGAAFAAPDQEIYAVAGDGCFLMTCQELATASHYDLRLTVIIVNNGRYGTIRDHQEREFPGRAIGTDMVNPDFCAFARSFGATAYFADTVDGFEGALKQARAKGGLNVIEFKVE